MFGIRAVSLEAVTIRVVRPLAVIAIWCAVMALGMRYFFSPMGAVAEPSVGDVTSFAFAFTISGLLAASSALVIGGKTPWALQIVLAAGLLLAALAGLAYLALWAAPWTLRSRMDAWSFLRLQSVVSNCGEAIVKFHAPLGAIVGSSVGAIAGGLIRLSRSRPALAKLFAALLLVVSAMDPVRSGISEMIVFLGMVIRSMVHIWPMTDEPVWVTAATFGAIAGAFGACLSIGVLPATTRGRLRRPAEVVVSSSSIPGRFYGS